MATPIVITTPRKPVVVKVGNRGPKGAKGDPGDPGEIADLVSTEVNEAMSLHVLDPDPHPGARSGLNFGAWYNALRT